MFLGNVNLKMTVMYHHTYKNIENLKQMMPSADQDMVQQKPSLTGAGIGSSTAARNESQQFLMKLLRDSPSSLFINLVLVQLI